MMDKSFRACALLVVLFVILVSGAPQAGHTSPQPPISGVMPGGRSRGPETTNLSPLVTEVYYNSLVANEYVTLFNPSQIAFDVSYWSLTDGEGIICFPSGTTLLPLRNLVVTQNSSLFQRDTLTRPDFSYPGGGAPEMLARGGSFRLNNDGDEVLLKDRGNDVVDAFVYGTSSYAGVGWQGNPVPPLAKGFVARRASEDGIYLDTNTSVDWNNIRNYVLGQSFYDLRSYEFSGIAQGVLSPDGGLDALSGLIDSAASTLFLNLYEFTNERLGQRIQLALERRVDVRILVEGGPVAGITATELRILGRLRDGGASVRLMMDNSGFGVKARYRYDHAKYMVVDNRSLFVSSENWGLSGFPANASSGNRGWSVVLEDPGIARRLAGLFLDDWNPARMDSVDLLDSSVTPTPDGETTQVKAYPNALPTIQVAGHFKVIPVVGPDNTLATNAVIGLLKSARKSLHIEQFFVSKTWGSSPNLFLEEAVEAARRGVEVRILLDSSWYNTDQNDSMDNDDTVSYLQEIAMTEGIPLSAKLGNADSHALTKFHNKGVVVDGERILVSSINWNLNSVAQNRELGLIVENRDLAGFFDAAFQQDWKDDVTPPLADAGNDLTVLEGTEVCLSGEGSRDDVGIVAYLWDIGGDGTYELNGSAMSWKFDETGNHTIVLRVEDAWGNSGLDRITVTVLERRSVQGVGTSQLPWSILVAVSATVASAALAFAILRRKK